MNFYLLENWAQKIKSWFRDPLIDIGFGYFPFVKYIQQFKYLSNCLSKFHLHCIDSDLLLLYFYIFLSLFFLLPKTHLVHWLLNNTNLLSILPFIFSINPVPHTRLAPTTCHPRLINCLRFLTVLWDNSKFWKLIVGCMHSFPICRLDAFYRTFSWLFGWWYSPFAIGISHFGGHQFGERSGFWIIRLYSFFLGLRTLHILYH